jgi:hypothetical protein
MVKCFEVNKWMIYRRQNLARNFPSRSSLSIFYNEQATKLSGMLIEKILKRELKFKIKN